MKGTAINSKVRDAVYLRDSKDYEPCCIICGRPYPQIHHYIERSRGGLGIPENLVCLCYRCHMTLHNTEDKGMKEEIKQYLMKQYPEWDEKKLVARKEIG